ncbi:MAG: hypothetical protein IPO08_23560 [Xanthomonadales bacterium]|nr:hypothetical protein [Xanthomonadales bacterium]
MERLPTAQDFNARRVTNPSQSEVVRGRFYDYQLYATAGVSQMTFFAQPAGSGKTSALGATAGTAKTLWDTNLAMANTLPSGAAYMIESIEVPFWPGSVSTADTYTLANTSLFNAVAAAAVAGQLNDVNSFYQSGMLELNILSKNYLRETPLAAFPPKTYFDGNFATASNSATTAQVTQANMRASGRPYYLEPEITLQPAVNFEVVLKWPAAVATPSGFNARVGVVMDGVFMRASQ